VAELPQTLSQFLLQQERVHPDHAGEFNTLLIDIALAAKMIRREVIRAGLVDILGYTGIQNVHGDQVQKLDQFAH
jgi:fructose-1,6-bisphosphatase I